MNNLRQNADGTWNVGKELQPGRVVRLEFWLRKRGMRRLAGALGSWDERGLGK